MRKGLVLGPVPMSVAPMSKSEFYEGVMVGLGAQQLADNDKIDIDRMVVDERLFRVEERIDVVWCLGLLEDQ